MELSKSLNDSRFCRQGKVSGYLSEMSDEDIKQFDEWTTKKMKELKL